MNTQVTRSELIQRQATLNQELASIHDEIKILCCLQNKMAKEISEIQTELEKREGNNIITLNCMNA